MNYIFSCFIDGKRIYINNLNIENSNSPIFNKNINNINNNDNEKWRYQEESLTMEEDIAESGRIFVRNLPYTTTEEELQPIFEKYGIIYV